MKELKVGDVRQVGDEVRKTETYGCTCEGRLSKFGIPRGLKWKRDVWPPSEWTQVSLIGHTILASDLMLFEFRRP